MNKELSSIYVAITVTFLLFSTASFSQQKTTELERPKLVVGIVVDQMRWDYPVLKCIAY